MQKKLICSPQFGSVLTVNPAETFFQEHKGLLKLEFVFQVTLRPWKLVVFFRRSGFLLGRQKAHFQGRLLLVFGRVRIVAILVLSEVRGIWGSCLELPGWYGGLWSVVDHVVVGNASCWYQIYPKFGWDDVGCCLFSREESGKKHITSVESFHWTVDGIQCDMVVIWWRFDGKKCRNEWCDMFYGSVFT